jgi:hypothetical protein
MIVVGYGQWLYICGIEEQKNNDNMKIKTINQRQIERILAHAKEQGIMDTVLTVRVEPAAAIRDGWELRFGEDFDYGPYWFELEVRGDGSTLWLLAPDGPGHEVYDRAASGDDKAAIADIAEWSRIGDLAEAELEYAVPFCEAFDTFENKWAYDEATFEEDVEPFRSCLWNISTAVSENSKPGNEEKDAQKLWEETLEEMRRRFAEAVDAEEEEGEEYGNDA